MKQPDYKNLSIPERILLVEEIWDSIADEAPEIGLSADQKNLLEERLAQYRILDVSERKTWEEIRANAKDKLRK